MAKIGPGGRAAIAAAVVFGSGIYVGASASPEAPPYENTLSQEVATAMRTGHALDAGKILIVRAAPNQSLLMADLQIGWTRMGSPDLLPPNQKANAGEWCGADAATGGVSDEATTAFLGAVAAENGGTSGGPSPSDLFKKASGLCMAQVLKDMNAGHVLSVPVGTP